MRAREHVSRAWWLLVIIATLLGPMGWIGGLVAWAYNRSRDPEKARSMLWLGITLSVILIIVAVVYSRETNLSSDTTPPEGSVVQAIDITTTSATITWTTDEPAESVVNHGTRYHRVRYQPGYQPLIRAE